MSDQPVIESDFKISVKGLTHLWKQSRAFDNLYRRTRGVHSSVLCDEKEVLYYSPDIGRHNTLDRIAGKCFMETIPTENKIVFCTGRFSSEMLYKLGRIGIPIAISRSIPTDVAVKKADKMGITLGSTKNMKHIILYSHPERILMD